jgi:predicted nucleotidyltransferase
MSDNPSPRLEQVLPGLKAELLAILENRPVMLAYLYGSVAEGHARPDSDVDIALVLRPDCTLSPYERMIMELDIAAEIEDRCGVREADVRSINDAPVMVQGRVLSKGIQLYSRDEAFRVNYEVHTRKAYFDFQPVAEKMREAFFAHMDAELRQRGLLADREGQ